MERAQDAVPGRNARTPGPTASTVPAQAYPGWKGIRG